MQPDDATASTHQTTETGPRSGPRPEADDPSAARSAGKPANLSGGHAPAPRLAEIVGQMLLPRLLRAPAVAARPERIVAGFVSVLVILTAAASLNGEVGETGPFGLAFYNADLALTGISGDLLSAPRLADRVRMLLVETPAMLARQAPIASAALLLIASLAWAVPGVFVCRGAGMELGRRLRLSTRRAFGFARTKGPASIGAVLLTLLIAAIFLVVPLLVGILLSVPVLDVVGGLVYGLGLIASAVSAFLLIAWVPASQLVLPAVACDGADPFDATQRAFGTVLARPLGVLSHLVFAAVQGVVVVGFAWILADLAVALAGSLGGAFSLGAEAIVAGVPADGTGRTASALVAVWTRVPAVLVASYAVSYAHAASTAVYLNARSMVDGQQPSEIWMPGEPAGVVEVAPPDGTPRGDHAADEIAVSPGPSGEAPAPGDGDQGSPAPRG